MSIEDLQKKIIPWHSLMPREEDIENNNKKLNTSGLIVLTSLIDK